MVFTADTAASINIPTTNMTDTTGVAGRQESDLSREPAIGNNKISDNAPKDCSISVFTHVGRKCSDGPESLFWVRDRPHPGR